MAPVIVPRTDHNISRRDVDPDALKVLYRLHEHRFAGYLVGGSVRDLLLGRRPKDFDIGTDAHPYQIKKLFRNCWIIGRRFRLAHVKFGPKTIEVATFRRLVADTVDTPADSESVVVASSQPEVDPRAGDSATAPDGAACPPDGHLHRDNTFGTPEEDAFRRDFTINGLFYDIGSFSVIDYVGGLRDLEKRVVRSIGDPRVRFVEDPVRMLRAVVMATRLGFEMDVAVVEAIAEHRELIRKASPARLLEEYYKILRSGSAEGTFRGLARTRLLELITPELKSPPEALWDSLARLDQFRRRTAEPPPELTNTILIGSLLSPIGALDRRSQRGADEDGDQARISFGALPVARRDLERLQHVMMTLPRLRETALPPRVVRGIVHRPSFTDSLAWLDVFGDSAETAATWHELQAAHPREAHGSRGHRGPEGPEAAPDGGGEHQRPTRRRRRRRRRGRGGGNRPQPE